MKKKNLIHDKIIVVFIDWKIDDACLPCHICIDKSLFLDLICFETSIHKKTKHDASIYFILEYALTSIIDISVILLI